MVGDGWTVKVCGRETVTVVSFDLDNEVGRVILAEVVRVLVGAVVVGL